MLPNFSMNQIPQGFCWFLKELIKTTCLHLQGKIGGMCCMLYEQRSLGSPTSMNNPRKKQETNLLELLFHWNFPLWRGGCQRYQ